MLWIWRENRWPFYYSKKFKMIMDLKNLNENASTKSKKMSEICESENLVC